MRACVSLEPCPPPPLRRFKIPPTCPAAADPSNTQLLYRGTWHDRAAAVCTRVPSTLLPVTTLRTYPFHLRRCPSSRPPRSSHPAYLPPRHRLTFSAQFMCLARPACALPPPPPRVLARADKRPRFDVRHVSVTYVRRQSKRSSYGDENQTNTRSHVSCVFHEKKKTIFSLCKGGGRKPIRPS